MINGLAKKIHDVKVVQIERDRNSLLQKFRHRMKFEEKTLSDNFRLGKEHSYKARILDFYIPSPWYRKLIFRSIKKPKNSNQYIKQFTKYADYQNEKIFLK